MADEVREGAGDPRRGHRGGVRDPLADRHQIDDADLVEGRRTIEHVRNLSKLPPEEQRAKTSFLMA
ncbi:hypothetical protein ACH414_33095 [Streptomyces sp. NPDC020422]|uniref:hypothetical protein n=1 Tax=Streptomyces sp. NPDC020422 TaxID=3365074 RepID=UPI00379BF2B1